eukprot:ANDGO_00207.mRNA.1 hypothetical protein
MVLGPHGSCIIGQSFEVDRQLLEEAALSVSSVGNIVGYVHVHYGDAAYDCSLQDILISKELAVMCEVPQVVLVASVSENDVFSARNYDFRFIDQHGAPVPTLVANLGKPESHHLGLFPPCDGTQHAEEMDLFMKSKKESLERLTVIMEKALRCVDDQVAANDESDVEHERQIGAWRQRAVLAMNDEPSLISFDDV